jgi:DNA-directed RNA polymerase subunit M/transcription elongation factor TFIIS
MFKIMKNNAMLRKELAQAKEELTWYRDQWNKNQITVNSLQSENDKLNAERHIKEFMESLKPHRVTAYCDKCHSDSIRIEYRTRKKYDFNCEYLVMVCDRCGFNWKEHTADSDNGSYSNEIEV